MNHHPFNLLPENYQPSNCADFSKIYNQKITTVTYTNLDTKDTEQHVVVGTEIVNDKDVVKIIYKLPPPILSKLDTGKT